MRKVYAEVPPDDPPEDPVAIDPLRVIPNNLRPNSGDARTIEFTVRNCDRAVYAVYQLGTGTLLSSRTFTPPLGRRARWTGSRVETFDRGSVRVQVTAYGSRGIGVTARKLFIVTPRGDPIVNITPSDTEIDLGESIVWNFRAKDVRTIAISGFTHAQILAGITSGTLGVSRWVAGSLTDTPRGDTAIPGSSARLTTRRITGAGFAGRPTARDSASVTVNQPAIVQQIDECRVVSTNADDRFDVVTSYYMDPQTQRIRNLVVVVNDRVWYTTALNPLRASALGTGSLTTIVADTIVRQAIRESFHSALAGTLINAGLQSVEGLVAACAASCTVSMIRIVEPVVMQTVYRVTTAVGQSTFSSLLTLPLVSTAFGAANIVGVVQLIAAILNIGFRVNPAALGSTLVILDGIFTELGITTIPAAAISTSTEDRSWTTPTLSYTYDYDDPADSGAAVLTLLGGGGGFSFQGSIRPVNIPVTIDGVTRTVSQPEIFFPTTAGLSLDLILGDLITYASSLVPGCRIGSIRTATVTDVVDV